MKRNLFIVFNIIINSPWILYRLLKYSLLRKNVLLHEFRVSSIYCIEGTLNQLIWITENSLFCTLSNSSKIYLNSNDVLFKVKKDNISFSIKSYGYNKILKSKKSIQVIGLKQKVFDDKEFHLINIPNESKTPLLNLPNNVNIGLDRVKTFRSIKYQIFEISKCINVVKPFINYQPVSDELNQINQINDLKQLTTNNYEKRLLRKP